MIAPLPQDPVFIVGYPRSGTTLTQGLLAVQTPFVTFQETHYFSVVEREALDADGRILPLRFNDVIKLLEQKTDLKLRPDQITELANRAAKAELLSKDLFETVVSGLLEAQSFTDDIGEPWRWIEKTPFHANYLPRIHACYPRLQVVLVLRHPVPSVYSRKRKFPFNRDKPPEAMAQQWTRMLLNVENFASAHPGLIIPIRYEDLIADPDGQLTAVSQFLGFTYNSARAVRYREALAPTIHPSEAWKKHDLSRGWSNTNEDYRQWLNQQEVDAVEDVTREAMGRYGYGPFLLS